MPPVAKNQNREQIARDKIDSRLIEAGWDVQDRDGIDFSAGQGVAVREYPTDVGPVTDRRNGAGDDRHNGASFFRPNGHPDRLKNGQISDR